MESALYVGSVRHVRHTPLLHEFRQRIAFLYLDLAELPALARTSPLLGIERGAPASFRRADHFGAPDVPLELEVRKLVHARTGRHFAGPIRLLTQPRVLGHVFNPISLYFCLRPDGSDVEAAVAEVTNTPWGERHCYVLDLAGAPLRAGARESRCAKALHVSPFMPMDLAYAFRIRRPGRRLFVEIANERRGERVFDAALALERRELCTATLAAALATGRLAPARSLAAIHWQALQLWLRRAPCHAHPRHARRRAEESRA